MKNFIIGLDIGIGSIGWAVLNRDKKRIEDFGVRIFDSGEDARKRERFSQQRRRFRGMRRLVRRRKHRKIRLKNYLEKIELTSIARINDYFASKTNNVIELRYKALSEKLSPEEIAACLIHICNNRGYKDFYEINLDELDDPKEKEEHLKEMQAKNHTEELMKSGKYQTPAEMIYKCSEFNEPNSVFKKYHNSPDSEKINLISRKMLEIEVDLILSQQSKYYKCLGEKEKADIRGIIFAQRDFETGPGNEGDKSRKFKGYLDTLGKCRYFKDRDRGSRFTIIADIYALINTLSQYSYIDKSNKFCLTSELAKEIVNAALEKGSLLKKDIKAIAKKHSISINDNNSDTPITKCFKYIKIVKPIFEKYGYHWNELITNYTDTENNLLNKVGIILSQSQTPRRRIDKLKALPEKLDGKLIMDLSRQKFSGTTNVCYEYMNGSIEAFLEGDIYGKFQAEIVKEQPNIDENLKPVKLPSFKNEDDCEFFDNPVVFRAINETRKLINAIINRYGYPNAVNIETADEVNRTFEDRNKDRKRNKKNQDENDRIINEIIELTNCSEPTARSLIEKYKLWEAQDGKCLYSGELINKADMLQDNLHLYEVDHIIPYSLILDNTINNKALVLTKENQRKGQRTPLMYMNAEQASEFRKRVNVMLKNKKCSKKKYQYLFLENLDDARLDEWKSRNLNDTRYICKYIVNYICNNLRFNTVNEMPDDIKIRNNSRVFAVKSRFTSKFRRMWLNEAKWGKNNKGELKEKTYLDHAADAIVIANCRPEYVILAGEKMKLTKMYNDAGRKVTPEYLKSKENCIDSLYKYYRMNKRTSERLLNGDTSRLEPIIPNLREEVDKRLWDDNTYELFWKEDNEGKNKFNEQYRANMNYLYRNDPKFAASVTMPLISYKPNHKYRGAITDENAISVKEIDGNFMQLRRKAVSKLKKEDIDNIYTRDNGLINTLKAIFADKSEKYTIANYLKENNLSYFKTSSGRRVNKVTVMSSAPARWLTKNISDNNKTFMTDRHYYCIELYKDEKGNTHVQGITLSDIVHKYGKLWLKPDFAYPKDYKNHIMYIFPGDYIRVIQSDGSLKFEGYYKAVKDINRGLFYIICNNKPIDKNDRGKSIAQKDTCIKLDVDLLGRIHGENGGKGIACGEPLSLLKEKS